MQIMHENSLYVIDRDAEVTLCRADVIIDNPFHQIRLHSRTSDAASDIYCAVSESLERGCQFLSVVTDDSGRRIFSNIPLKSTNLSNRL